MHAASSAPQSLLAGQDGPFRVVVLHHARAGARRAVCMVLRRVIRLHTGGAGPGWLHLPATATARCASGIEEEICAKTMRGTTSCSAETVNGKPGPPHGLTLLLACLGRRKLCLFCLSQQLGGAQCHHETGVRANLPPAQFPALQ